MVRHDTSHDTYAHRHELQLNIQARYMFGALAPCASLANTFWASCEGSGLSSSLMLSCKWASITS